jgi:hypothetical protein
MAFILDTNVVSELRKGARCNPNVRRWVETTASEDFYISVMTLGELRGGIESLRRRDANQAAAIPPSSDLGAESTMSPKPSRIDGAACRQENALRQWMA